MNKESFKFAGTYISICIGSGFATGQEIMQFFSSHGIISVLSSIFCMVLMMYAGSNLFSIGKNENLKDSNDVFVYLMGEKVGNFFKLCMPILFFFSFIVMIAGSGASISEYYGISKGIGSLIMGVLTFASVTLGMNKIINILGNIGPIIAVFTIIIGIVTIFNNIDSLHMIESLVSEVEVKKAGYNWYLSSIMYTGLNLVLSTTFLVSVGSTAKDKKSCIYGGIIGGAVFMMSALILNIAIMSDIGNLYDKQIPTLFMAKNISPIIGMIFSVILIAGIYTTATPLLWSFSSSFYKEKSSGFVLTSFVATFMALLVSKVSFSSLVNAIYPVSGLFGVLIISAIIIRSTESIFLKKRKRVIIDRKVK